jgi:hypothetical protein
LRAALATVLTLWWVAIAVSTRSADGAVDWPQVPDPVEVTLVVLAEFQIHRSSIPRGPCPRRQLPLLRLTA